MNKRWLMLIALYCYTTVCYSDTLVVKYINNYPGFSERYYVDMLDAALKATEDTYGSYRIDYSEELMSSSAKHELLLKGDRLDIDRLPGYSSEKDPKGSMIRINYPLLQGFMSYRIPLIMPANQEKFDKVKNLADLRKLTMGLGLGWETYIYKENGFIINEGNTMYTLLKMLAANRYYFVPLSALEIDENYRIDNTSVDVFQAEKHLLLAMPLPVFFYVSGQKPELAKRLDAGLKRIDSSGQALAIFDRYYAQKLKKLHLSERTIIELSNPDGVTQDKLDYSILKKY